MNIGYLPVKVTMPKEGWGRCKVTTCQVIGDTADGLCMRHWDSAGDRTNNSQRRRRNQYILRKGQKG